MSLKLYMHIRRYYLPLMAEGPTEMKSNSEWKVYLGPGKYLAFLQLLQDGFQHCLKS